MAQGTPLNTEQWPMLEKNPLKKKQIYVYV